MADTLDDGSERIGKCDCGGTVYGVRQFDQVFSWCDTCSPVVTVDVNKLLSQTRKSP